VFNHGRCGPLMTDWFDKGETQRKLTVEARTPVDGGVADQDAADSAGRDLRQLRGGLRRQGSARSFSAVALSLWIIPGLHCWTESPITTGVVGTVSRRRGIGRAAVLMTVFSRCWVVIRSVATCWRAVVSMTADPVTDC
jgi:hypothetical protein